MTMRPRSIPDVPDDTAKIAKAAFRKGNVYMQMRDELGTLYEDKQFGDLFPQVGRFALVPWRLALVTVMQFAENLTDRQAADAVRGRIDWKYALSLDLTDEGFDFSVLSEFRGRLIANQAESRLFELLLAHLSERGLLKAGGKQRTDATYVLGSVRNLNRLEFVGETLRSALNALADTEPDWLLSFMPRDWFERYGRPFTSWRLPRKKEEVEQLAQQIGEDGITLLTQVYLPQTPLRIRQIPEVEIVRQVWLQQFYQQDEQVLWRKESDLPPPAIRFVSPYDMDVRSGYKGSGHQWRGYKVHYSETCEDDSPNLITDVQTTLAAEPDLHTLSDVQASLAEHDRLPETQFADGGYTMAPNIVSSEQDYGINLIGPVRDDPSWQRKEETGYDISQFQIDFATETVICPQGHRNQSWRQYAKDKQIAIRAGFSVKVCRPCPARELCCRKDIKSGRAIVFQPEAEFVALHARRQWQQTPDFWITYNRRAGIESTMFQAVTKGVRESRYRGLAKTNLQHWMIATAINLFRGLAWLAEVPRVKARPSSLARLAPA